MDANRTTPSYELKDELARYCLPAANQDSNLRFAWVNSICILFLLVGILGARRGLIAINLLPPLKEFVPVVIEPMALPPQATTENKERTDEEKSDAPQVVMAFPNSPNINFAVPTIGSLVAPAALASAPPLEPLRTAARIGSVSNTGRGGERPQPPYPKIALEDGEQGTVVLLLSGDEAGNITSIDVKESSGFPVLDHATVDYIKRHWRLPVGAGNRLFETSIIYQLQMN
jgi:TonB family protein